MRNNIHYSIHTIFSLALGLFLLPHSMAKESQDFTKATPALRSFIPVVLHHGELHPIVGVKKKKPLINIDGKLTALPKESNVFFLSHKATSTPTLLTGRNVTSIDTGIGHGLAGASLGEPMGAGGGQLGPQTPGNISQGLEGNQINRDQNNNSANNDQTQVWENITSTNGPLHNAYGVFIFYSNKGIAELQWRNIKDAPEGKERPMRIPYASRATLRNHENPRYIFLAFQDGEELVPSDHPERNRFLSWNEINTMSRLSTNHKKANHQQTVEPSLIFRPDFALSESAYKDLKNREISANITINALGIVSKAYLDSEVDSSTANEILKCIRLWKFLPAIKEGKQIEKEVVIPLQF